MTDAFAGQCSPRKFAFQTKHFGIIITRESRGMKPPGGMADALRRAKYKEVSCSADSICFLSARATGRLSFGSIVDGAAVLFEDAGFAQSSRASWPAHPKACI